MRYCIRAIYCTCIFGFEFFFFFFKQKTAYEMRISDWSSDVCSSDLPEKRHSSFQGAFKWFINHLADELNEFFAEFGVFTNRQIEIGRASCRERVCQYV